MTKLLCHENFWVRFLSYLGVSTLIFFYNLDSQLFIPPRRDH